MGKLTLFYLGVFLLVSSGDMVGQEKKSSKVSPNIIIFIADDLSATDLEPYGNSFVQTPNISFLAKNGLKFNNAILTTSSCSPSRISIMTGRYPHNTGAAELHTEPEVAFESMASKLNQKGYYTGHAGKWHMGSLLKQGFDNIYENYEQNGDGGEDMWIPSLREREKNKPFFFWFASYDPHRIWGENQFSSVHNPKDIEVPLTLIDNDSTRIDLSKYYNEIKRFDFHIGKVIEELKRQQMFENTIIIVMADNGRPFPRDKTRLYHSGIRTPLIIHWPKFIKRSTSNSLISSIDIAPTILDVCGIVNPKSFQGKSFLDIVKNPNRKFRNYAFAEHNWHDYEAHERMVRTTEYLYILNFRSQFPNQGPADAINSPSFRSLVKANYEGNLTPEQADVFLSSRPTEELYELKNDPFQINNIVNVEKHSKIHLKLKDVLLEWMDKTCDNVPNKLTTDWYSRNTGKRLKENFGIRREMPGKRLNADQCNEKGQF
ncbi:sulfatase [Arenibacter palladensis]|uniref:sulfatase family protein n=1 Tax=Arenibacter palladensis TaxID=237373 RepID=UPI002FD2EF21